MSSIYVIGSLRNPEIPTIAQKLREAGFDAFDDWHAAGPDADDHWRDYEQSRGHSYAEALQGYAGRHVFSFDLHHLKRCDLAVLVMPGGKSAHLELGWFLGQGKPGFVLFDQEPERYDVMYQFASGVFFGLEEFLGYLRTYKLPTKPKAAEAWARG